MKPFLQLFQRWTQMSLVLRILIGLVIGAVLGMVVPEWTGFSILGQVFVSALKAIAPVLVAVLVAASIAKAGGGLGPRFRVLIFCYVLSTFIAALCAVVGSFLFPVTLQLNDMVEGNAPSALNDVFTNLLTNMVTNPLMSVSSANYIGILFWAILVGIALKACANKQTIDVVSDFAEVISQVVKWVIQFAPFGILGLVFSSVSEGGLNVFSTYGHLVLLLVGCMFANTLIFNPLISFFVTKKNPYPLLFTCLKESGINAFFTRSSAANIPINMTLCKRLKLDEDFYSVSIPLGATINMDGTAIYQGVCAIFIAACYGINLTFPQMLTIVLTATLASIGTAGVPGAGMVMLAMVLSSVGLPVDGIALVAGIDRIFDMGRTTVNITGDAACSLIVSNLERKRKSKK